MNINHAMTLGTRAAVLLAIAVDAASTASAQYAPAPVAPNNTASTLNAVTSLVTGQPAPTTGYYQPNAAYPGYAPAAQPYAYTPGYAPTYPTQTYYQAGYRGYVQPQPTYAGQQYTYTQQQTYPYTQPMTGNRYVDAARTIIQPQYQPAPTGYYYQQPAVQSVIPRR